MISLLLMVMFAMTSCNGEAAVTDERAPEYLYKVLSVEAWEASQKQGEVLLSSADHPFIHLSTEEQLPRILDKYFAGVSQVVILKLETHKLPGRLVLEVNPGGVNRYWHLYQGSIPADAIVAATLRSL